MMRCYCSDHCRYDEPNGNCYLRPGGFCFVALGKFFNRESNAHEWLQIYECIPPEEEGSLFQCMRNIVPQELRKSIKCCSKDMCNNKLDLEPFSFPPNNEFDNNSFWSSFEFFGSIFASIMLIIILSVILIYGFKRYRRYRIKIQNESSSVEKGMNLKSDKDRIDFTVNSVGKGPFIDNIKFIVNGMHPIDSYDSSLTSGSGSGPPVIIQPTIAKQIQLNECIGKGRYGEVWRGVRNSENIAVKVFSSHDEASWNRETEMYSNFISCHENILGFLGSDITSFNSCTQLWLITDFHEFGSLYDYLNSNYLEPTQMMSIMLSIISGLLHLHTEFYGQLRKPAIAHRDIKSKNILMKSTKHCCIADFGLAVIQTQNNGEEKFEIKNHRVGTKRYMAPEVLNETMKIDVFESFRMADIYSLALVFWEVARCSFFDGLAEKYSIPFGDSVPNDPSFEEMHKIVYINQIRPVFHDRWKSNEILSNLAQIIGVSWAHDPSARLSALRIKESLLEISDEERLHK